MIKPEIEKVIDQDKIQCLLCPHLCVLSEWEVGRCAARTNSGSKISSLNYAQLSSIAVEPIEKKPFLHILQGTKTLSVGSWGCTLSCGYCENYSISQQRPNDLKKTSPKELLNYALENQCKSICFTFNEPIISYEYILDVIDICEKDDIKILLKTNAFVNEEIWTYLLKKIYAVNIDFKGCSGSFKKISGAKEYVLKDRIEQAIDLCKVEVSVPLYYKLGPEMFVSLEYLGYILYHKDKSIPCHLLRVNPAYKLINEDSTSDHMVNWAKHILERWEIENIHIFNF